MRDECLNQRLNQQPESGFTLIELMAALLISSVLLMAMYQNFIVTHRSYQLLEGYSLLQENARFSEDVLARTIRMTGYRANPGTTMGVSFATDLAAAAPTPNTFPASGQVVSGENNNATADVILNGTDSISIRFQGNADGTTRDCLNDFVAAGGTVVNTFYVRDDNSLHCSSDNGAGDDQPIADGIVDMQILYGVDTSVGLVAGTYLPANTVTAAQWSDIVSVRIAVLYSTLNRVPDVTTQSFTLLDNGTLTFTDGLRRQLFTSTINLRNRSL